MLSSGGLAASSCFMMFTSCFCSPEARPPGCFCVCPHSRRRIKHETGDPRPPNPHVSRETFSPLSSGPKPVRLVQPDCRCRADLATALRILLFHVKHSHPPIPAALRPAGAKRYTEVALTGQRTLYRLFHVKHSHPLIPAVLRSSGATRYAEAALTGQSILCGCFT